MSVQAEEKALLPSDPERSRITAERSTEAPKRKKGPKAPNPLSVKKKKVRTDESNQTKVGEKRKFEEEHSTHPGGGGTLEADGKPKRKRRKKISVASVGPG